MILSKLDEVIKIDTRVKSVSYGDVLRINDVKDKSYPAVNFDIASFVTDTNDLATVIRVYVIDRTKDDRSDEIIIQKDTAKIIFDFVRNLRSYGVQTSDNININTFSHRFVDQCAGVWCDLQITDNECLELHEDIVLNGSEYNPYLSSDYVRYNGTTLTNYLDALDINAPAAAALVEAKAYTDSQNLIEVVGLTNYVQPKGGKKFRPDSIDSIIYDVTLSSDVPSVVVNLSSEQDIEIHIYGSHSGDGATGSFTINDVVSANYITLTLLNNSFSFYLGRYLFSQIIRLKRDGNGFIYMENNAQQRYGTVSNPLNADRIIHGILKVAQTGINKITFNSQAGTNILTGTNIKVRRMIV